MPAIALSAKQDMVREDDGAWGRGTESKLAEVKGLSRGCTARRERVPPALTDPRLMTPVQVVLAHS